MSQVEISRFLIMHTLQRDRTDDPLGKARPTPAASKSGGSPRLSSSADPAGARIARPNIARILPFWPSRFGATCRCRAPANCWRISPTWIRIWRNWEQNARSVKISPDEIRAQLFPSSGQPIWSAFGDNFILVVILGPLMREFKAGKISAEEQSIADIYYTSLYLFLTCYWAPLAGWLNDRFCQKPLAARRQFSSS